MKKILFTILVCSLYSVYTQAQCFDFYVKTPNNSNIKACTGGGYSLSQVQSADAYSRTFAVSSGHVYEAGTDNYNCHGYAWHVKEGGNKVWIDSSDGSKPETQRRNRKGVVRKPGNPFIFEYKCEKVFIHIKKLF